MSSGADAFAKAVDALIGARDQRTATIGKGWSHLDADARFFAARAALLAAHAEAVAEAEARGRAEALAAVDAACEAASGPAGVLDLIRTDDGWNAAGFATDAYGTAASAAILAAAAALRAEPAP